MVRPLVAIKNTANRTEWLQRVWQRIQAAQAGEAVHGVFFCSACSSPDPDSCMRVAACPAAVLHACASRQTTSLLPHRQLFSTTQPLMPFDLLLPLACCSWGFFLNLSLLPACYGFPQSSPWRPCGFYTNKNTTKVLSCFKALWCWGRVEEPNISVSQHGTDETMKRCC